MTINYGGPAFPGNIGTTTPEGYWAPAQGGMSLREWYAGQMLAGLRANGEGILGREDEIATEVYKMADAMIAAREKTGDPRDPDVEYDRATEQGVRHE